MDNCPSDYGCNILCLDSNNTYSVTFDLPSLTQITSRNHTIHPTPLLGTHYAIRRHLYEKVGVCRIGRSPVTFQNDASEAPASQMPSSENAGLGARPVLDEVCPPMKTAPETCHAALYTPRFCSHWTMAAADDSCWRQCAAVIRPLQSTLLHLCCRCRKFDCTGV